MNARSLCNKLAELYCVLYNDQIDILFVTESWLHSGIPNGLLDPNGKYNIVRRDRPVQRGGGVCIMIDKKLPYYEVLCDTDDVVELIAIDVVLDSCKYRFINVYRPPTRRADASPDIKALLSGLKKLCSVKWPVTILGDFNCPDINWSDFTSPCDGVQDKLLDCFCEFGMTQLVNTVTCNDHILDLVLTNEQLIYSEVYVDEPFANSDHNTVRFSITDHRVPNPIPNKSLFTKYCWKKANFDGINERLMSIDWSSMMTVNFTADTLWAYFSHVLQCALNDFVPITVCHNPINKNGLTKYPARIRAALKRKQCLWRLHKRNPNDVIISSNYRRLQAECRKLIRDYEIKREENIISANNTGKFYSFVNGKMACSSGVGALKTTDGSFVLSDSAKAELLNEYFVSVGTHDNGILPPVQTFVTDDVFLDSVDCSEDTIRREINHMKSNGSPGPDGIPPVLLKKIAHSLITPLSLLFSSFLSVGQVPAAWKSAIVTPIHKSGLASDPANYRPISLTSVFCKLMERVINRQMIQYLQRHKLLSGRQHGFLAKRSTVTNLLDCLSDWTLALDNRHSVTVAYIDYSKAFDMVSHNKLLHKLSCFGICGNLLRWIGEFLNNRTQCVRVGSAISCPRQLISGVIQGSVLGPLLFLLYVDDVVKLFSSGVLCNLYADDLKLYSVIQTSQDVSALQSSLDALVAWSDEWQLKISSTKSAVLCLGQSKVEQSYQIKQVNVSFVPAMRDLGVIIDNKLTMSQHVATVVSKARARASLIFKCFHSKDRGTLLKAFTTYVRPLLEYATPVWSPFTVTDITKIESVQRAFTKRLPGLCHLAYTKRLDVLCTESLELRRLRYDLIYVYKMLFGLIDLNFDDFFVLKSCGTTRGHNYKLFLRYSRLNIRKHFFSERVVTVWNNLECNIVDFGNLRRFKLSLLSCDLSKYVHF